MKSLTTGIFTTLSLFLVVNFLVIFSVEGQIPNGSSLRILFSDESDLCDSWGRLEIGVSPVETLGNANLPDDFTMFAAFPREGFDGEWEVFGRTTLVEIAEKSGPDMTQKVKTWKLLRTRTHNGREFTPPDVVYEPEAATYTDHFTMAKNPDTGEFLLLNLKMDDEGFQYFASFSPDGQTWSEYEGNPIFRDGDSMSVFWSPVLSRFVCVNKTLQPYRKRYIDHGGATPSLGDDSLRDRRVLMIRTSPDGRCWEPSVDMEDVWNRHKQKSPIPTGFMITPDANDPPELEFYSGRAFWYHDRAYMMVLNYAASPLHPRQHAPQLDNEWWTSLDGMQWERPARNQHVLEPFPSILRLETTPIVTEEEILFEQSGRLLGLKRDRISFVSARANGEFSTRPFVVPAGGLFLNAATPSLNREFATIQSFITVSVLDQKGQVIPGFESEKCLIKEKNESRIPLVWDGKTVEELAGKTVRLRFVLRGATIYAVTGGAGK